MAAVPLRRSGLRARFVGSLARWLGRPFRAAPAAAASVAGGLPVAELRHPESMPSASGDRLWAAADLATLSAATLRDIGAPDALWEARERRRQFSLDLWRL